MNIVIMTGKIVNQMRTFYSERGLCVVRFNIQVQKNVRKNASSVAPNYDTFNCVIFGKQAETLSNFAKVNDQIMVKGKLAISAYENKDQQKVYMTEVQVQELKYLEKGNTPTSADNAGDFCSLGDEIENLEF